VDQNDAVIELMGEPFILMPEGAIYLPQRATLLVADTHWGKTATFRARAIPIPEGSLLDDLSRLSRALIRSGARRLVVLGDLLHARAGRDEHTMDQISGWRAGHPELEVILVRGNHDRGAGDPPADWRMQVVDEPLIVPPFLFQHTPLPDPLGYVIAGHLHPGVTLSGRGRQSMKLPCFWFGVEMAVLPAFGSFTGLFVVQPRSADRIYVIADGRVIPVKG
jgi:DNA ligase-associated metallophosphoesterase